jgi:hypothetical protein
VARLLTLAIAYVFIKVLTLKPLVILNLSRVLRFVLAFRSHTNAQTEPLFIIVKEIRCLNVPCLAQAICLPALDAIMLLAIPLLAIMCVRQIARQAAAVAVV